MPYYVKNSRNEIKEYSMEGLISAVKSGKIELHDDIAKSRNGPWKTAFEVERLEKYFHFFHLFSAQQGNAHPVPVTGKTCKFCLCTIKTGARKCQHCGEWLDGTVKHDLLSNIIAAILSVICPGAGQVYLKDWASGVVMFSAIGLYVFGALTGFIPFVFGASIIHFWSIVKSLIYQKKFA